ERRIDCGRRRGVIDGGRNEPKGFRGVSRELLQVRERRRLGDFPERSAQLLRQRVETLRMIGEDEWRPILGRLPQLIRRVFVDPLKIELRGDAVRRTLPDPVWERRLP